jgi:hypothetical protein
MAVDQFGNPLDEEELRRLIIEQQRMGLLPGPVDTFVNMPATPPSIDYNQVMQDWGDPAILSAPAFGTPRPTNIQTSGIAPTWDTGAVAFGNQGVRPQFNAPIGRVSVPIGSDYSPQQLNTPINELQQQNIPSNVVPLTGGLAETDFTGGFMQNVLNAIIPTAEARLLSNPREVFATETPSVTTNVVPQVPMYSDDTWDAVNPFNRGFIDRMIADSDAAKEVDTFADMPVTGTTTQPGEQDYGMAGGGAGDVISSSGALGMGGHPGIGMGGGYDLSALADPNITAQATIDDYTARQIAQDMESYPQFVSNEPSVPLPAQVSTPVSAPMAPRQQAMPEVSIPDALARQDVRTAMAAMAPRQDVMPAAPAGPTQAEIEAQVAAAEQAHRDQQASAQQALKDFMASRAYQQEGASIPAGLIDVATEVDSFANIVEQGGGYRGGYEGMGGFEGYR